MGTLEGLARQVGSTRIRSSGGVPVLEETYGYTVLASSPTETYASLLNTAGLPVVGVTVSPFGLGICTDITGVRDANNASLWHFTGEFSSEVEDRQGAGNPAQDPGSFDPEEWIPIIETKYERVTRVSNVDATGAAVANSAGQLFPTGITKARYLPVWEFFQFEPVTVTDENVISRCEVINSNAFKGRAAKTLLCVVLSSVVGFYYGAARRLTQYRITYDRQKWTDKRLDVGQVFLSGGQLLPYTDQEGNVILGGLNGSGAKVAAGSPPAILEFDPYPQADFSSFLRV